jgi:predicted RNA-binding Zn-ribbon protein involved in translation (DUF1610 family)
MPAAQRNGSTRAWRQKRARILAASSVCHICGHTGADSVDHVVPWVISRDDSDSNLRPAHHQPCPECGIRCNREKSDKPFAPVIRRSGSLRR